MEPCLARTCYRRALAVCHNPAKSRLAHQFRSQSHRQYATGVTAQDDTPFQAASPYRRSAGGSRPPPQDLFSQRVRVVPASPSYFTATPNYTDDVLSLAALLRKHQTLPIVPLAEAPRIAWKKITQYKVEIGEPVRVKGYSVLIGLLRRLNCIHPSLIPDEVVEALAKFKSLIQPPEKKGATVQVDAFGRTSAIGRRKSSSAKVYLVEGEGQCLVNGRSLTNYFGRLHDRESALWALKATERLDKYNVWALVRGGGTTGQAEAITLGVARALMAHEPDLKRSLRKAGVVTRDHRRVERKKPGKLKARKMPAWVKR